MHGDKRALIGLLPVPVPTERLQRVVKKERAVMGRVSKASKRLEEVERKEQVNLARESHLTQREMKLQARLLN